MMMTLDTPSLLRRLQALQHQIAEAPRHGASLRAARNRGDRSPARRSENDAGRYVSAMVLTAQRITAQVVPADGLGAAPESLSELVLRGVRLVVLAELGTLRDLLREPSASRRSRAVRWGCFRGIEDLTTCVRGGLDRITEHWRACRGMGIERAAYRAALRAAHASMRELGTASEFARFLGEGVLRHDWTELQGACARTGAALTLPFDVDPDVPVVIVAWSPDQRVERAL
jgi:hypothetical protein